MNKFESRRHHYIPQFLIKNFSDDGVFANYYNKKTEKFSKEEISNLFVFDDLYRDEENNPYNPVEIETELSKFESEVALILKKFLVGTNIVITPDENDALLLFFSIVCLRSKRIFYSYGRNINDETKEYFEKQRNINDVVSFWKKNLLEIVKCRKLLQVIKNKNIDDYFKILIQRDTFGIFGKYIVVAERRGGEDFFLSDICFYNNTVTNDSGIEIQSHSFIPISPSRIIILAQNGITFAKQEFKVFSNSFLSKPYISLNQTKAYFSVKKIYEGDVKFINDTFLGLTKEGIVVKDLKRFHSLARLK